MFVNAEIVIPDEELELTYVRSSGPGGQAVNKVSSKARLRWNVAASRALPAGVRERFFARYGGQLTRDGELLLTSDRFRDQRENRRDCLEKLRELLLSVAKPPKARRKTRPGRGARERAKRSKQRQSAKKRDRSGGGWD